MRQALNSMKTMMVHMLDRAWTQEALHYACQRARESGAEVALLRLVPTRHARWLGTEFAYRPLTLSAYGDIGEHVATAEDYGFRLKLYHMSSLSTDEALIQAAEQFNAGVIVTRLEPSFVPYWNWFQTRRLEKLLRAQGCELCLLDSLASFDDLAVLKNSKIKG